MPMKNVETDEQQKTTRRKKVTRFSPEEEQKIISWFAEGLDIQTVAAMFEQETGKTASQNTFAALWKKHLAKIHLVRRNYFARLASQVVDGAFVGEQALDAANIYLLKQTLFEHLIEPGKDPKHLEALVKAIKAATSEKSERGKISSNSASGLSEDTLSAIEEMAKLL